MSITDMVRLAEDCRQQGNQQGARIIETAISQELARRNEEDSGILDRILVDVGRIE